MTKSNLNDVENVCYIKAALGSIVGKTNFVQSYEGIRGSRIGNHGDNVEKICLETLDHVLNCAPVTFIKMDIEGAELEALKGSINTLRTYKPKLAKSLYHKNEDLIDIPLWINKNIPRYKYYLRHYSNKRWELVLYCV